MALLKPELFERTEKYRNTLHKPVKALYTSFEQNGQTIFQVDTYGTSERIMPEKISQSLQIDKQMAHVLVELLRKEFKLV